MASNNGAEAIFGPRDPDARHSLSYSKVNQLLTCGEQFRLERIEHLGGRPSSASIAGRIIHSATEAVDRKLFTLTEANYPPRPDVSLLDELYEDWTNAANVAHAEAMAEYATTEYANPSTWLSYGRPTQGKPHGEDLAWFVKVAIPAALEDYIEWRLQGDWDVMAMPDGSPAIEIPFTFELPSGLPLRGVIDRVLVSTKTGQPLIVDLKSGQKPKTDGQLALYRFGLEKLIPFRMFGWGAYYYGMKRGGTFTQPIDISHWTPEMLQRVYETADTIIAQRLFVPNPGEHCWHCPVQKHCDFFRSSRI